MTTRFRADNIGSLFTAAGAVGGARAASRRCASCRKAKQWSSVSSRPKESQDVLLRRIGEASQYVPKERLVLSTQCGFASAASGNLLSHDDMLRKLELVARVAHKAWR